MYAIAFDLNQEALRRHYPGGYVENAYADIQRVFATHGFERQQGSVYFGRSTSTSVHCVLAVQEMSKRHAWFRHVVTYIRIMRIEENNDLYPALGEAELPFEKPSAA